MRLCPLKGKPGFCLLPLPSLEAGGGGAAMSLPGKSEMAVLWMKAGKAISVGSERAERQTVP